MQSGPFLCVVGTGIRQLSVADVEMQGVMLHTTISMEMKLYLLIERHWKLQRWIYWIPFRKLVLC